MKNTPTLSRLRGRVARFSQKIGYVSLSSFIIFLETENKEGGRKTKGLLENAKEQKATWLKMKNWQTILSDGKENFGFYMLKMQKNLISQHSV